MKANIKKAQEEMFGFGLIVVIIVIALFIFLGFSLKNSNKSIESYEVESFIQASLQHTTECRDNLEYLSIQKLIFECNEFGSCIDGKNPCEVLNSTIAELIEKSWKVEEGSSIKGNDFRITINGNEFLYMKDGNVTKNYKGSVQDFSRGGNSFEIYFNVYY